ncbi:hypothetical protein RchiOBHm_Chr6g0284571 [Rosa chinensis]|uniref:Uncharacterized protein n=1 Tax=Rosa chinensis TaxID=74649 RepID=A0A2P6PUB7_ROSCH|nr:hypothetical protein RchiOBHm_Chr6g0284571 [Rosa chinensis]
MIKSDQVFVLVRIGIGIDMVCIIVLKPISFLPNEFPFKLHSGLFFWFGFRFNEQWFRDCIF